MVGQGGVTVSVVIPMYNHAGYIETCLDSLLAQSFPGLEILLLDDGSRDDGFAVARRWEAAHGGQVVRTWFERQPNAGITRTLDRLVREARGEFIVLLASDDWLLPDSIRQRLEMLRDPAVDAVFGDAVPVDEAGQPVGRSAIADLGIRADLRALKNPSTLLWELIFRWNVYGSVLMCRRSALVREDGRSVLDLSLYSEDMQLYYRFAGQGRLRFLDQPVAGYRIHAGSTCRTPEHLARLRANIHGSRRYGAAHMRLLPQLVVRLQAFTYYRWQRGIGAAFAKPLVALDYGLLLIARLAYDLFRRAGRARGRLEGGPHGD